jgi:hypothetical protein
MPTIDTYTTSSLTARELIRLAHSGGAVYAGNYGVVADDTTDDTAALQAAVDACFGPYASPKAREDYRLLVLPPGIIKITSPIALSRGLNGGMIVGQGRFATQIRQNTSATSALVTNGCQYSHFANFMIRTEGGICFDLDYDGSGTNGCALQSNTFANIFFDAGDRAEAAAIGCRIGNGGYMGSENIFFNCFWIRCKYGINTLNFNALQNTIIGGNMQTNQWGVYAGSGSVTLIDSVGFQQSSQYDIEASASAYDTMVINSCRTESPNFVKPGSQGVVITGCTFQGPDTAGYFLFTNTSVATIKGCQISGPSSIGGKIKMGAGGHIDSCYWTNPDLDILDPIGPPTTVTFQNLSLNTTTYLPRGWIVGKYIHDEQIPNGTVKWNYNDKEASISLYGDDFCMVQLPSAGDSGIRANTSKSSGKWYWEVYLHYIAASSDGAGVANSTYSLTAALGDDTNGIIYLATGLLKYNNTTVGTFESYTTGDTICFALDKDNNKLWVRKNGGNWNNSGTDNPATNTGGYTISVTGDLFPTAYVSEDYGSQVFVPQSRRWKYTAPSGFSELT